MRAFTLGKVPQPDTPFLVPTHLSAPYTIELGCGVGHHSLKFAEGSPSSSVIAIERTKEKFRKLKQLESANELDNFHAVQADAIRWVAHNIGECEAEEYFILYPNPYPKEKQKNKRFHNMPFTEYMLKTLKPGGRVTVATNIQAYAEEAIEVYSKVWGLELIESTQLADSFEPRTLFEKKYLERGEICWNLVFRKRD